MKKIWKIARIAILMITAILMILSFSGCASSKKAEVSTPVAKPDSLRRLWQQSLRENISISDSVTFYNNYEIKIDRSFFKEFNTVEEGVICSTDSINEVLRTVPVETPGKMIDMIGEKNNPKIIKTQIISFSANDIVFTFSFSRKELIVAPKTEIVTEKDGKRYKRTVPVKDPKSFILVNKASIFFRGVLYKNIDVTAVTKNDDDYCSLLVDYRKSVVTTKDSKSAEGR